MRDTDISKQSRSDSETQGNEEEENRKNLKSISEVETNMKNMLQQFNSIMNVVAKQNAKISEEDASKMAAQLQSSYKSVVRSIQQLPVPRDTSNGQQPNKVRAVSFQQEKDILFKYEEAKKEYNAELRKLQIWRDQIKYKINEWSQ